MRTIGVKLFHSPSNYKKNTILMSHSFNLAAMQAALREQRCAGWLFADHHHRDAIAGRLLGLPPGRMATRRWFYLVPAEGAPRKLIHRIEAGQLEELPGEATLYSSWRDMESGLRQMLTGLRRVAMQYSPRNALPALSVVDGGMLELVRETGAEVISSADLVAQLEAVWTPEQLASHRQAGKVIDRVITAAFRRIRQALDAGETLSEYDLQQWMIERMAAEGVTAEEPPIVAINSHAGDPHYEPSAKGAAGFQNGDLVLLDVWGKCQDARAVYYDVTWMGAATRRPLLKIARAFTRVRAARDAAFALIQGRMRAGEAAQGWEADRAARQVMEEADVAGHFTHRTGHSIGTSVHGYGPNLDSLETHDIRRLRPGHGFSIEPGLYYASFGIRLEVNVYLHERDAEITGPIQNELITI